MACGTCRSGSSNCGGPISSCAVTVDAACVFYNGNIALDQIGGTTTNRLEQLLINLNERLRSLTEQIQEGFIGINVGGGAEIYKGLNGDGVGELRTIANSDSIIVTQGTNTLSFAVRTSYIESIIGPITGDISALVSRVATLEGQVAVINNELESLDARVTTLEGQYVDLYEKYNLQQTQLNQQADFANVLDARITALANRTTDLENLTASHTQRITALEQLITEIASAGGIPATEERVGEQIITLSQNASRITGVYHNGIRLHQDLWVYQSPNLVSLQLARVDMTVEATDVIIIDYLYTPSNILDTLQIVLSALKAEIGE